MKKRFLYSIFTMAAIVFALSACNTERAIETDASFTVEKMDSLRAGAPITINFEGSGDFVVFYTGRPGSIWGDSLAKGETVTGETHTVKYSAAGEYTIAMVATSYGNWAEEEVMDVMEQTITVTDDRKIFSKFSLTEPEVDAAIIGTDVIFTIHDQVDLTAVIPEWKLGSDLAKVYVGDVEQESGKSVVDLSNPVVYKVVAGDGSSISYTVSVETYPASTEADILTLGMKDHPREAVIDDGSKEVYLYVPSGTDLTSLSIYGTASEEAEAVIGTKELKARASAFDVSTQPTVITVTAESGDTEDWDLYTPTELAFTEFKFGSLVPEISGTIDIVNLTVDLKVLEGTDIENLVADFTLTEAGTVEVGSTVQSTGVTANDFTEPVIYKLTLGDMSWEYTVTVSVVSK